MSRQILLLSIVLFQLAALAISACAQTSFDLSGLAASTVYITVDAQVKGTLVRKQSTASGVVITQDGYVLTAAHIIPDLLDPIHFADVHITGSIGSKYGITVPLETTAFVNTKADIAFLKFPETGKFKAALVSATGDLAPDAYLTILGFPLGLDLNILHGRITTRNGPVGTWITDAKAQDGSSGSPVFDAYGQLVGVLSGGFQGGANPSPLGLNEVIPISLARSVANVWHGKLGTPHFA